MRLSASVSRYATRNAVWPVCTIFRDNPRQDGGIVFASASDMQKILFSSIGLPALTLWALGCGGGGGTPAPTGPSSTTPPASTTVNIVSSSGSSAFNPNPVQVPSGGTIQWRNATADPHVLVMSDGSAIGTVAPGATLTTTLSGAGGNFRCTNHPSMVGSINGTRAPDPPSGGGGDDY